MFAAARKKGSPEVKEEANELSSSDETLHEVKDENTASFPNYLRNVNNSSDVSSPSSADEESSADSVQGESDSSEKNASTPQTEDQLSEPSESAESIPDEQEASQESTENSQSDSNSTKSQSNSPQAEKELSTSAKPSDKQSRENAEVGKDPENRKQGEEKQEKEKQKEREVDVEDAKKEAASKKENSKEGEGKDGAQNGSPEQAANTGKDGEGGDAQSASGPQSLEGAAGGGGEPSAESGEESKGGTEQEGEDALNEAMAKADPERAEADENEDPADVATAQDDASVEAAAEESDNSLEQQTENMFAQQESRAEQGISAGSPGNSDSSSSDETANKGALQSLLPESLKAEATQENTEQDDQPEDDPESVEGISGDEPALGGAAVENSPPPILSEPEINAAYGVIGESSGGGGAGGGGGGGGGGAAEEKPAPEAPDVSSKKPEAALAAISSLPPGKMQESIGDVSASVSRDVGKAREELAADLPQMERPSGSPKNLQGQEGKTENKKLDKGEAVKQAEEGQDKPTEEPKPLPEPPPSPAEKVKKPAIAASSSAEMSEADMDNLSGSLRQLPTSDPALNTDAGPAPNVDLSGNADPAQIVGQRKELNASVSKTQAEGQEAVAQEMGENTKIFPSFAPEVLVAKAPAGGGGAGGGAAASGGVGGGAGGGADPFAVSFIAQKEKGGEIQAAIAKGQSDFAAKREDHATQVSEERAKADADIAKLDTENTGKQEAARSAAQAEVKGLKGEWTQEQTKKVSKANEDADSEISKTNKDINKEKQAADKKASEEISKGNKDAVAAKDKGEKEAQSKKSEGEQQSSKGFWGWLGSKATAFFDGIKKGIKAAFDLARKAIKFAIETARKAAMWAIEQARKAVVGFIKGLGKLLIAIGDVVLAGFPELHDKYTKSVEGAVEKSVEKVNELADDLKAGVNALLDALAAGLNWLVDMHEKAMLAVVDVAAGAVDGAIKFGEKVAQALGVFAVLIKDIAGNPGGWISNLGAGAVDGIKNHLWGAFKSAVKEWFNSKLESVLGLGAMVWDLIKGGGLSLAKVGKMAWEGIKAMIPAALIGILIEKLVALVVPAAGAVMAIIEGLQAAWGSISRIIAAFGAFFTFLKAVKSGSSGPQFATAVAAGAIAVIDFVANWLIAKLAKGAAKIGGKIKGLAKKLMGRKKGRKKAGKAKSKKDSKAGKVVKPKLKPKPKLKGKAKSKKGKKAKDKKEDKKKQKEKKKKERLKKAIAFVKPKMQQMANKGTPKLIIKAKMLAWKARFRIRKLKADFKAATLVAGNSPDVTVDTWYRQNRKEIYRQIQQLATDRYQKSDRHEPAIADEASAVGSMKKGETRDMAFGGQQRRHESWKGEGNVGYGAQRGSTQIKGEPYGNVASRAQADMSSQEVGGQMAAALRGGSASPDAADLAAISFGADVSRSRAGGGFAEVSARLALHGLKEGALTPEQVFGNSETEQKFKDAQKDLKGARVAEKEAKPSQKKARKAEKSRAIRREKLAKRRSGGILPQSMKGFVDGRKAADKFADPKQRSQGRTTEGRKQANQVIDRTVKLVYEVVKGKVYDSVSDLIADVKKILIKVDKSLRPTRRR